MELTEDDLNLIREWFDSVQDLNPDYLEQRDYRLQVRVLRTLDRRVPHDVLKGAGMSVPENET